MSFGSLANYINPLDIGAAAVILIFMGFAGRRGLVKSLYKLFAFVFSIFLANLLYPHASRLLRDSGGFYERLKNFFMNTSWIPDSSGFTTKAAQNLFISGLDLPDFMKFTLMEHNNPDAYAALNADGLTEYIGGFLANLSLNIISMLLLFIVIYIVMRLLGKLLDAVTKLPVISALNRLGGLVIGFFQGVIVILLIFTGVSLFLSQPNFSVFMDLLERSELSKMFYDNNFILHMVTRIVP